MALSLSQNKLLNMKTAKTTILMLLLLSLISCKAETKKEVAIHSPVSKESPSSEHYIRVALLLDTSNSMDGLIDQAKAQLWEIVNELSYANCRNKRPNLEIALYEYGNDKLSEKQDYIRKILGFTQDLDEVSKELFSLTTDGGSEYCGAVIHSSLENLDWGNNSDDLKMIFIAGNEPFDQGTLNYKDAASNAKEKDIVVNTIFCGDYKHGVSSHWKDGATLTYGDYISINHNQQTVHIESPYDDPILQLNIKLNKTYVYYGRQGQSKATTQYEQDDNAGSYGKANAVSRTVTKGSHLYKNGSWDLVDAEEEIVDFSYDKVKKEDLPDHLKDKSTSELKAYVAEQREERNKIQADINKLNEKRRLFILENKKDATNGLEDAMIKALKKQAKKKEYTWD